MGAMISDSNRLLAKTLAKVFAGKPSIARYWDERERHSVDVMTCEDSLQENVISYSTLGLSDHPIHEESPRVEFVAAFGAKFEEGANIIATAAFCVIRSKWRTQPGAIFPDVVSMYRKGSNMKHLLLCQPFLWEELLTQELSDKTVAWLLLVPISENELQFAEANGSSALEDLFVEKQIDVFDLDRRSVL
jgi:hypothetical protein